MKRNLLAFAALLFVAAAYSQNSPWGTAAVSNIPGDYNGRPFADRFYMAGPQAIPGRVELAYYDLGGEGVAYHDSTSENLGTNYNRGEGQWRPGIPEYIAFFRSGESVDITYTKESLDYTDRNRVDPKINQLYIGWQAAGEWTNYTVNVMVPGRYRISSIYANKDSRSELWLNGELACRLVFPRETGGWHVWDQAWVGEITFPKAGLNLLTLKYNDGTNLAFFDFVLIEEFR